MTIQELRAYLAERAQELLTELDGHINSGVHPDSYGVGRLEGAIEELERIAQHLESHA